MKKTLRREGIYYKYIVKYEPEHVVETRELVRNIFIKWKCDRAEILEYRGNSNPRKPKGLEKLENALNRIKPIYGSPGYGQNIPYVDYNLLEIVFITGEDYASFLPGSGLVLSSKPMEDVLNEYGFHFEETCEGKFEELVTQCIWKHGQSWE